MLGGSKGILNDLRSRQGGDIENHLYICFRRLQKITGRQIRGNMLICAYAKIQVALSGAKGSKSGNEICSDYGGAFNQANKTSGG
jgi:hypothetical protein